MQVPEYGKFGCVEVTETVLPNEPEPGPVTVGGVLKGIGSAVGGAVGSAVQRLGPYGQLY
ncbi:unnamed protein product [Gongylonema pulchrum]|uniref:Uncharacterized protein n=1 Tax=Gongylonema pulchrum TaxID=637853 RepID=A0A3P6R339_9BILA|nr:unnamed protein product [Gongylonema pulchrum]